MMWLNVYVQTVVFLRNQLDFAESALPTEIMKMEAPFGRKSALLIGAVSLSACLWSEGCTIIALALAIMPDRQDISQTTRI
jgi:hypothetical protein